ncbi:NADH-quinone oxidoreductase subunit NuoE [Gemmatimonas phototrophica]|uniref:NADH-quinone oxidoreductase n=1 Tax=Gemmatimonas phototrophica TaxID=1379270 RepID=A0A143BL54_9BACT|nr:NADH-quinone oxidoreductase subunit NuoE [Gemmatimonas phototrophica]AMW05343.1 NADH-quinone oxidoreductase [Gemmatimonas phototrophica]
MTGPMNNIQHLIPEFERWKERYPAGFEGSLTIPCLRRIQEERGYIADSDIDELVAYLGVPRTQVDEVLGFYTMFTRTPLGHHHLQVCHNVSCSLRGADGLLKYLCGRLGIQPGETTPDGKFTVSTAECLASCGTAPMMMVNEAYHENLTPAAVDALLEELTK